MERFSYLRNGIVFSSSPFDPELDNDSSSLEDRLCLDVVACMLDGFLVVESIGFAFFVVVIPCFSLSNSRIPLLFVSSACCSLVLPSSAAFCSKQWLLRLFEYRVQQKHDYVLTNANFGRFRVAPVQFRESHFKSGSGRAASKHTPYTWSTFTLQLRTCTGSAIGDIAFHSFSRYLLLLPMALILASEGSVGTS